MDKEVDIEIKISEIFEYQELDLPYYIQQKINNVVLPLGFLSGNVLEYIEKKEYKTALDSINKAYPRLTFKITYLILLSI